METRCYVTVILLIALSACAANKYCAPCDKMWVPKACEMYCCLYADVCQNSKEYSANILDRCKCSAPTFIHPYCLIAERGNLTQKEDMCKILKANYPQFECKLCDNLEDLTTTPAPTTTAIVFLTMTQGASTKKPISEYCRNPIYCYYLDWCECKITEPTSTAVTTVPTTTVPATTAPTTTVPTTAVAGSTVPATTVAVSTAPTTTAPTTAVPATTAPTTAVPATTVPISEVPTTIVAR